MRSAISALTHAASLAAILCVGLACNNSSVAVECVEPSECPSGVCDLNHCAAPTCFDAVKNGAETAVDCGGPSCAKCVDGSPCPTAETDCASGACRSPSPGAPCVGGGRCCAEPTCADQRKNGDETDVDCGGPCASLTPAKPCAIGQGCAVDTDCASLVCDATKRCGLPLCKNQKLDGDETDVDCGGACAPCVNGKKCKAGPDCASASCNLNVCAPADCTNGVQDGQETSIDCGGPCVQTPLPATCKNKCPTCAVGLACALPRDCASGKCINTTCAP